MEKIKINSDSFWPEIITTIFNLQVNEIKDTCTLRRYIIFSILFCPAYIVVMLEWYILSAIINIFMKNDKIDLVIPFSGGVAFIYNLISFILLAALSLHLNIFPFSPSNAIWFWIVSPLILAIAITIFVSVVFVCLAFIKYIDKLYKEFKERNLEKQEKQKSKSQESKVEKPSYMGELYKSWKEKYCKQIEWE